MMTAGPGLAARPREAYASSASSAASASASPSARNPTPVRPSMTPLTYSRFFSMTGAGRPFTEISPRAFAVQITGFAPRFSVSHEGKREVKYASTSWTSSTGTCMNDFAPSTISIDSFVFVCVTLLLSLHQTATRSHDELTFPRGSGGSGGSGCKIVKVRPHLSSQPSLASNPKS